MLRNETGSTIFTSIKKAMKYPKIILFSILLLYTSLSQAQNNQIIGSILDNKGNALPFANVVLMSCDSINKAVGQSDINGLFKLPINLENGSYLLKVS